MLAEGTVHVMLYQSNTGIGSAGIETLMIFDFRAPRPQIRAVGLCRDPSFFEAREHCFPRRCQQR